ncbi:MAG: ABC transporter ATP-binding protein [Acetobacteraceae bacterium]|nr:ABC transporter ATP-binding protein [Acetobacteraceae bacterium]
MSSARIIVNGVSVSFPLYHGNARSLKKTVMAAASGRLGKDRQHRVVVQALKDISFTLLGGDRLGLVGPNGAGKTTLLRTLAGIYEPIAGTVRVSGTLNALLDSSLGMNMDLTGGENIVLRGLYGGLSKPDIARLEEDVAEFAGLGDFLDLPVRIYSAGMMVRLGFALATAARPQVLLMDEWILTGDAEFMERARVRLENMVRGAEILVLSTHDPNIVQTWCSRVLWLDQGQVRADGPPRPVLEAYLGRPVPAPVEMA